MQKTAIFERNISRIQTSALTIAKRVTALQRGPEIQLMKLDTGKWTWPKRLLIKEEQGGLS